MPGARGLSFVELLVTLVIATIVGGYALGIFTTLVAGNRQTGTINNVVTSLLMARSHAITHHEYVLVCPSSDGVRCDNTREWHHGWLVRAAPTAADVLDNAALHTALRTHQAAPSLTMLANRDYFLFRPFARRATNGTLVFCPDLASVPGKAIIISYTGRPRVARHLSDGRPVPCAMDSG
ncbi:MAG: hypothetical protein HKN70_06000 [Gammaproteobacteria bacterium]|nr:hypothetical protein [Gammaproteobacteria bacterium]